MQAELKKAADLDPANGGKYYYNLGAILVNSGQNDAAGEAFKKAIDAPHGQLRIVGDRRAYADDDRIDQRPQPMQMDEAGLAVDVVGVSARGGDAGVDGLAALPHHDEVIDLATTQRAENALPRVRQGTVGAAKRCRYRRPR